MQVVPFAVSVAARAWDEQHNDVAAAADQVGDASTGGFSGGVAGVAARFSTTWRRHMSALADQAEARADGLRTAIADCLVTDEAVRSEVSALRSFVVEGR